MRNPIIASLMAAASAMFTHAATPAGPGLEPSRGRSGRKGSPGPHRPAGSKLARIAAEGRIGLTNITQRH